MKTTSVFWQPALQAPGEIVRGLDDIWQAIQIILRPHVVRESVDAIRRWEPRCQLMSVKPAVDGEHLTLRVSWKGSDGQPRTQELLWR